MNTVLKYVIGLDLLNCRAKCCGDTISRSRESKIEVPRDVAFEVAIFGSFPDIPELKLSLPSWVMEGRM